MNVAGLKVLNLPSWRRGRSSFWQYAGAVGALVFFAYVGWGNNGLWYQGDSSIHATNGLFWSDLFLALPLRPVHFALGYYARFPSISPIAYPPFFYLVEAAAYGLFGPSPFVGKALVIGFSFLGALYVIAWMRRWVAQEAGWLGILFLLQPAILVWGHAVMLNVPCTALGVAALYHWRRWLEEPTSNQIWYSASFAILAVFTYLPTVVIVLVMLAWAIATGRFRLLLDRRAIICAILAAAPLLLWTRIEGHWDEGYRQAALYLGPYPVWKFSAWTFYIDRAPELVRVPILALAVVGLILAWIRPSWRTDATMLLIWLLVCYVWFSVFAVKEPRYALLLIPPLLILAAIALTEAARFLGAAGEPALVAAAFVLLLWQGFNASALRLPVLSGFSPIVAYLRHRDPNAWIFYDGNYSELFTYYYRLQDPDFSGGVVRADKLLYATNIDPAFGLRENVSSVADVMELVREDCGCRYVVAERRDPDAIASERYLREALRNPEFHLLASFPVDTRHASIVDVYQYTGPLTTPTELTFRFPVAGDNVRLGIKPIGHR